MIKEQLNYFYAVVEGLSMSKNVVREVLKKILIARKETGKFVKVDLVANNNLLKLVKIFDALSFASVAKFVKKNHKK